jgi:hypothetical protein
VEIQRAYRARLKVAGKAVRLVDAGFDPATPATLIAEFRDQLHNTLAKLELREQAVARLEARNRFLESELVRLEREATQAAKDRIIARREAAAFLQAPGRGRRPRGNWSEETMPSRRARLLAALALHPEGLVVDILLAGISAPEERRPMLTALRRLEGAGLVVRLGPCRHHYIAGVLVRLAAQPAREAAAESDRPQFEIGADCGIIGPDLTYFKIRQRHRRARR